MPIAAQCPNCGGPLSETSVLALAPVCERCGTVITKIGGTLGLTSAYGVNDPTITRKRVEADLAVFSEYRTRYVGMLEVYKEQLKWDVERYAKLPCEPDFLSVVRAPPLWKMFMLFESFGELFQAIVVLYIEILCCYGTLYLVCLVIGKFFYFPLWRNMLSPTFWPMMKFAWAFFPVLGLISFLCDCTVIKIKNGRRPFENERRQKTYKAACAAAMKDAELVKAKQDYRLSVQIRELDGLIETVTEKAEGIRKILRTL